MRAAFIDGIGGLTTRIPDNHKIIEEAVRTYLLQKTVEQAKSATNGMGESELNALIDEAVQWARKH